MSHFNYENITTYTQRTATDLKVGHLILPLLLVHVLRLPSGSYFIVRPGTFSSNKINTADLHDMYLNKGWLKI